MPQRLHELRHWLDRQLGGGAYEFAPASSDASFRRYFRITRSDDTLIAMDAPPEQEDSRPYIEIARRLLRAGLTVPEILASDLEGGFLLVTDLGIDLYLSRLDDSNKERLYGDAVDALFTMQTRASTQGLPDYDRTMLRFELGLFSEWFLGRHLGLELDRKQRHVLDSQFELLTATALAQPRVFVHRDYHSRNLMFVPKGNPGILDFQGAVLGPVTYDLVSLLRDCYIAWPEADVARWARGYHRRLMTAGLLPDVTPSQFLLWFDLMGLQRHLKAIGIFARLHLRDGKPDYLHDIPRTLDYVLSVTARYADLAPLGELLEDWHVQKRHQATLAAAPVRAAVP